MTDQPPWLPIMFSLDPNTQRFVRVLYRRFECDFIMNETEFENRPIIYDDTISKGYELGFWHLITGKLHCYNFEDIDYDRARRLNWCSPVISHSGSNECVVFNYENAKGYIRTYIWLKELDYVVIVQIENIVDLGECARLITAYYFNKDWGRDKIQKKYNNRIK